MKIVIILSLWLIIGLIKQLKAENVKQQLRDKEINSMIKIERHCMQYCLECQKSINSCTKCTQKHNCCNWACSKCVNQTTCSQCQEGFYLDKQRNICVMQNSCDDEYCVACDEEKSICTLCELKWYIDPQMLTCDHCLPNCLVCNNHQACINCEQRYYLVDSQICLPCSPNCLNCKNSSVCQKCDDIFFINQIGKCQMCMDKCLKCQKRDICDICQQKTYFNKDQNTCVNCQIPCNQCKSQSICTSCIQNYFFNITDSSCKSCPQFILHCAVCQIKNQTFRKLNIVNYVKCITCEKQYFYKQSNNSCLSCPANCQRCDYQSNCNQCLNKYYLTLTKKCQLCKIQFCIKCQNQSFCSFCSPGYYWNNSNLIQYRGCKVCQFGCQFCYQYGCLDCVQGFYLKNAHCYRCHISCQICKDESSQCMKCMPGYFINGNTGNCYKCPQPCTQCINMTNCKSCIYQYYLNKNICQKCSIEGCDICNVQIPSFDYNNFNGQIHDKYLRNIYSQTTNVQACSKCGAGYILISNNKCEKCSQGCLACNSSINCFNCFRSYYLDTNKNICLKCPVNCTICIFINQVMCQLCIDEYYIDSSNHSCKPCGLNCLTCVSNICIQCKSRYYLNNSEFNVDKMCIKCTQPCNQCQGQKLCLNCIEKYYLNAKNQCIKCQKGCLLCNQKGCFVCDQKYHLEHLNSTCIKCKIDKCLRCQKSPQICQECQQGYTNYDSKQNFNSICFRCDQSIQGCKTCISPLICTSCFNGLNLQTSSQGKTICNQNHDWVLYWTSVCVLLLIIIILTGNIFLIQIIYIYRFIIDKQKQIQKNNKITKQIKQQYDIDIFNKQLRLNY